MSSKRLSRIAVWVLQPVLRRTNPASSETLGERFDLLERTLPFAIVFFVLLYNILFTFALDDAIPAVVRFAIDNLIFGILGALVTIISLEWLRHHFDLEALREQEANTRARQLAAIMSNSADAILFVDNNNVIQSWNRGAELIFGYRSAEIVGKHFHALIPENLLVRGETEFIQNELVQKGYIRNYVTQRLTRAGNLIAVELTRTLLRDDMNGGAVIGSSVILRDVTERERIQEQTRELNRVLEAQVANRTRELLAANQELSHGKRELEKANANLRQLDQLKSEFVSMVSHELRAPLANISGVFQLLLEDERDPLSINQHELVSLADEQVGRLGRLVKGVLNVSRIEAGETEFNLQELDLLELIEKECTHWSASDSRHKYSCLARDSLPAVWADRDRVDEVLMNLMDNATKYSQDGTTILVAAHVNNQEMVISVQDEGAGISTEELTNIFDKFYRVERDDARETYGHGLGLYISRKFIEGMGGKLWAESELGHGSTFYFSLPLAKNGAESNEVEPARMGK
jgi:PAS domain S-box-containing protein